MYQTAAVLQSVDRSTAPILVLCALALVGNYIYWLENLRLGFRAARYSMPVACLLFFLPHDATYLALYPHWFYRIDHWFPKLWWYGLTVTVLMELAFLVMLLRFGRKELAPESSQGRFVSVILLGLLLSTAAWLALKSFMNDELFLGIFGVTIFWCAPFNFALMVQRRSAVGQSVLAWIGYLMMPIFYWPATWLLAPEFHTWAWNALGTAAIVGGLVNLRYIYSNGGR